MNRADLHSAFTKINLWKQTQFSKIVYVDADVVAYRAPDELFDQQHNFSAAPDIGWPDLFNTGVMALTPNMGDYYAMLAMAERGISFDGADQGLLNMHFKHSFNRLPFTYNVTPSGHYQYVPAYRHFQSSISMVHFIGATKPWFSGRESSRSDSPFDEMTGRWWAVYDRHFRAQVCCSQRAFTVGRDAYRMHRRVQATRCPQDFLGRNRRQLWSRISHLQRLPPRLGKRTAARLTRFRMLPSLAQEKTRCKIPLASTMVCIQGP